MSLQELLDTLAQRNVQLWTEGENLRIRAPKGTLTESERSQLRDYKAEILTLLQQSSAEQPIEIVSRNLPLCLSIEQERLWLANQFITQGVAYNLVQAVQLKGKLEIHLLEKSINKLLQRHEVLRTNFDIFQGQVVQVINNFSCRLVIERCQVTDLNRIADAEAGKSFDLATEPLWRFRLLKIEELEYILVLVFHHSIGDILSTSIFIRELAELYNCSALPNLSIQYADFAFWQRQELEKEKIQKQLIYWESEFLEIPKPLTLPIDSNINNDGGMHHTFKLSYEVWNQVKQFGQQQNVTPAAILLTAFEILLYRCSEQEDIVIGYPVSGRFHPQLESLIGFFAYPLPFKVTLDRDLTFQDLLKKVKDKVLEITTHQNVPYSKIVDRVKSSTKSGLFQVLFSTFLGKQLNTIALPELTFTLLPQASRTPTDLDLLWSLYEVDEELQGVIGYNKKLFKLETIKEFIQSYCNLLQQCLETPELTLNQYKLTQKLEEKVRKPNLVISATFTAETLNRTISFWLKKLDLSYQIKFAPYNQVFQQLFDSTSLLRQNDKGVNVILIRLEDWLRFEPQEIYHPAIIEKNLQDLILGLQEVTHAFVCICPTSKKEFEPLEDKLILQLNNLPDISYINSQEIVNMYSIKDYHDFWGDQLGHIPYTDEFYTVLGTIISRKIYNLNQPTYKVIALDCDNTLWRGVCGEDGIEGIIIDEPFRQLQEFILEQKKRGMLLCLCSKNNLDDVYNIFEYCSDMVLKWTDFVAVQINWQDKFSNLENLSKELNLGLDSFIFIDDNPVECAAVIAQHPEILTLQLPENGGSFLQQVWAFDRNQSTREDEQRTTFYRENLQREESLKNTPSLAEFINSLNLQIEFLPMSDEQISRVSQLTQRTNQFNATAIKRTETEIKVLLQSGHRCLTVGVKDRFGDYGLVGTMIYSEIEDTLKIDTFLLSCRTLGRGVEYSMLAELGKIALEQNLDWLEITYVETEKNQPILNFLQKVGEVHNEGHCFRFPSLFASQIIYQPDTETVTPTVNVAKVPSIRNKHTNSDLYQQIATQLATVEQISSAIASTFKKTQTTQNYLPPRNEIETHLAQIWSDLLKVEKVGIHDNFFDLGGDSILMIQIVTRAKQMGLEFTPMQLFENQTIAELVTVVKLMELEILNTGTIKSQVSNTIIYTPSDFPDVDLSQEELDNLLSSLE